MLQLIRNFLCFTKLRLCLAPSQHPKWLAVPVNPSLWILWRPLTARGDCVLPKCFLSRRKSMHEGACAWHLLITLSPYIQHTRRGSESQPPMLWLIDRETNWYKWIELAEKKKKKKEACLVVGTERSSCKLKSNIQQCEIRGCGSSPEWSHQPYSAPHEMLGDKTLLLLICIKWRHCGTCLGRWAGR